MSSPVLKNVWPTVLAGIFQPSGQCAYMDKLDVTGIAHTWPLVGRERQLTLVCEALARPTTGGVVVAGPPGVGKTRLADEVVGELGRGGRWVTTAFATRTSKAIPFGAFAHLLPESLPKGQGLANLVRSAADAVVGQAPDSGLVVVVDDAFNLDDHSAALAHHLVVTRRASLLVTVRDDEPAPDAIESLWKEGLCERVELAPLPEAELAVLLGRVLGGPVEALTVRRLWQLSRGNPLYLRELVLAGEASGSLKLREGVWCWTGPVPVSGWLVRLVEMRLGGLSALERATLEVVAAADVLEIAFVSPDAVSAPIVALQRKGLLEERSDGRRITIRLAHPLYAEVLRASMPPARRRSVVSTLAEALGAAGARRRLDVVRLALWRLEAGVRERPEILLAGARQAAGLLDYPLAARLAEAAWKEGVEEAAFLLAHALVGQGAFQQADAHLEAVAEAAGDEAVRARAIAARATNLCNNLQRRAEAVALLEVAEAGMSAQSSRRELAASRSHILFFSGRYREACDLAFGLVADPNSSPAVVAGSMTAAFFGLLYGGRVEDAKRLVAERLDDVVAGLGDDPIAAIARPTSLAFIEMCTGCLTGMERVADELSREALDRAVDWLRGYALSFVGFASRLRGRPRSALRWLVESTALMSEVDLVGQTCCVLGEQAHALALLGRVEEAEAILRSTRDKPNFVGSWVHIAPARIWTVASRGEVSRAKAIAHEEADEAHRQGNLVGEVFLLHEMVRLGAAREVAGRMAGVATSVEGPLSALFAEHARVLADDDAVGAEKVSAEFDALGYELLAAEAASEAARLYERQSARRPALVARARASRLAAGCEGARTPALAALSDLPLTAREREVGTLAARGLSNGQIAELLVVSVRTVENHLQRIFDKLGLSSRQELGPLLLDSLSGDPPGAVAVSPDRAPV